MKKLLIASLVMLAFPTLASAAAPTFTMKKWISGVKTATCKTPWGGAIGLNESVTAYQVAFVPEGQGCNSEVRKCEAGILSGTYSFESCLVTHPNWQATAITGLVFADSLTGVASGTVQTVSLTNTGNGAGSMAAPDPSGANPTDFKVTSDCVAVPVGLGCMASITFTPNEAGPRSASIVLGGTEYSFSGNGIARTPTWTGTGSSILTAPTATAGVPATATSVSIPVQNTGSGTGTMAVPAITGPNASDYSASTNCNAIGVGNSCSVSVQFSPTAVGNPRVANLTIGETTYVLSGEAIAPAPVWTVSGTPVVDFGSISQNETATATLVLQNTGTGAGTLAVPSSFTGANPTSFSQTNNCTTVAAGASCTINVTFNAGPTLGAKAGTLTVNGTAYSYTGVTMAPQVATFNYSGAKVTWTAPKTGKFIMEVWGAKAGGNGQAGWSSGGNGAKLTCSVNLTAGTQLSLLVGGQGTSGGNSAGGGGGGSYVATASGNTALVVAGGGAGSTTSSPGAASTGLGGTGNGGGANRASGGGGFSGNGATGVGGWFMDSVAPTGGQSFVNGGTGSTGSSAPGGYGGGGGGIYQQGGGGGGYTGGSYTAPGTSYCSGTLESGPAGTNAGNGQITITY